MAASLIPLSSCPALYARITSSTSENRTMPGTEPRRRARRIGHIQG
ncbi:MAG: hypothetical protein ABWU84_01640 [Pyrobaculum sp.]